MLLTTQCNYAFRRGERDYNAGKCVVYRNVQGRLVWDMDDDVGVCTDDRTAWANAYIAGYDAAEANAEKDADAMCAK